MYKNTGLATTSDGLPKELATVIGNLNLWFDTVTPLYSICGYHDLPLVVMLELSHKSLENHYVLQIYRQNPNDNYMCELLSPDHYSSFGFTDDTEPADVVHKIVSIIQNYHHVMLG